MTKWTCYTCGAGIDTTLGALDHAIANEEADIWPVYSAGGSNAA